MITKNKDNKISKQMRISLHIVIKTTNNNSKISKKDSRNNSINRKKIKCLKMCNHHRLRIIIARLNNLVHLNKDKIISNNNNSKKMNFHPL